MRESKRKSESAMKKKNACLVYRLDDTDFIKKISAGSPHPDKKRVLDYLHSGEIFGQTSAYDPTTGEPRGDNLWTDGEWVWDDLLTEQVFLRNFKIDDSFLQHMKNNNWEVPEIDFDEIKDYEL